MALNEAEVAEALSRLRGWSGGAGGISKCFRLADFAAAIRFVDALARVAEALDHHPDIDIRYDRVTLGLVTHDAGGVTDRDLELARRAEDLAAGMGARL